MVGALGFNPGVSEHPSCLRGWVRVIIPNPGRDVKGKKPWQE